MESATKAYILKMGKAGWAIMGQGIFAGVQGYLDIANSNWNIIPMGAWLTMLIVGLVLAPFFAFRSLYQQLQGRPDIEIEPVIRNDHAILEVHNVGKMGADFTAKARVISGSPGAELYSMRWQSVNKKECHVNAGDTEPLLVGEISPNAVEADNPLTAIFKGGIALYKMGKERIGASTFDTVQAHKDKRRYPVMLATEIVPKDECVIEVTITSEPPPKEDFGTQQYSLEVDHTSGNKLTFTNVSNLNKE